MREPEFRPLNDAEEEAIVNNASHRHPLRDPRVRNITVNYERQPGGFCVCVILVQTNYGLYDGFALYRGCSRRSYKDEPNRVRGEMIAFVRAVKYSRGLAV